MLLNEIYYGGCSNRAIKGGVWDENTQSFTNIRKQNKTQMHATIEYNLLTKLKKRGFPVVNPIKVEGDIIELETVDGGQGNNNTYWGKSCATLADNISYMDNEQSKKSILFIKETRTSIRGCMDIEKRINYLLDKILTDEQKEFLNEYKLDELAKKTGTTKEYVKENMFAIEIIAGFEWESNEEKQEFMRLFEPIKKVLDEGLKKYGQWIGDGYPKNFFLEKKSGLYEKGRYIRGDLNSPKFTLSHIDDVNLMDAKGSDRISEAEMYDLIVTLFFEYNKTNPHNKLNFENFSLDGFIHEEELNNRMYNGIPLKDCINKIMAIDKETLSDFFRLYLIEENIKTHNTEHPDEKIDLKDYMNYMGAARFFRNIQLAAYRLKKAKDISEILKREIINKGKSGKYAVMYQLMQNNAETYHHTFKSVKGLQMMELQGLIDHKIAQELLEMMGKKINSYYHKLTDFPGFTEIHQLWNENSNLALSLVETEGGWRRKVYNPIDKVIRENS